LWQKELLPSLWDALDDECGHLELLDTTLVCKGGEVVRTWSVFLCGFSPVVANILKSFQSAEDYHVTLEDVEAGDLRQVFNLVLVKLRNQPPETDTEQTLSALTGVLWSRIDFNSENKDISLDDQIVIKHEDLEELDLEDGSTSILSDSPPSSRRIRNNSLKVVLENCHPSSGELFQFYKADLTKSEDSSIIEEEDGFQIDEADILENEEEDDALGGKRTSRRCKRRAQPSYYAPEASDDEDKIKPKNEPAAEIPLKHPKKDPDADFILDCKQETFVDERNLEDPAKDLQFDLGVQNTEKCPVCDLELSLGKSGLKYKTHLRKHKISSYKCDCAVGLDTQQDRENHIQLKHWGWLQCEFCTRILEPRLKKLHYKAHKARDPTICDILDLRMPDQYLRKKREELLCVDCGQKFITKKEREDYSKHMEKHMVEQWKCDCMGANLRSHSHVIKHIKVHHRNQGYKECSDWDCNFYTRVDKTLADHIAEHHTMKHMCDMCGLVCKDKYTLKDHYNRLHTQPDQECTICKLFFTAVQLRDHRRRHQEETCPQCNKRVKNLKKHIGVMHTPDSEKKHKCQFCEKGFVGKKELRDHTVNVHTKTRPYPCRYGCDIAYNDNSNRNQHEKRKHGQLFPAVKKLKS